ncbi:MAG: phosphomannose isomerase type II C-terminal cupin domain, partial [Muribaculaceae bacterium]|nr:phosphomannose isomerase type II C-terminal cupin domain [Muribaculaceae bacterium]
TKQLTLNPGCSISYQRHTYRDEVWTFIDGEGEIVIDGNRRKVSRGDTVTIIKTQKHTLRAITPLTFIEVQRGSNLVEEDIERFDFEW